MSLGEKWLNVFIICLSRDIFAILFTSVSFDKNKCKYILRGKIYISAFHTRKKKFWNHHCRKELEDKNLTRIFHKYCTMNNNSMKVMQFQIRLDVLTVISGFTSSKKYKKKLNWGPNLLCLYTHPNNETNKQTKEYIGTAPVN